MTEPTIQVKVHQAVGTISIHRDEKRNALTRTMIFDLIQAFRDLHGEKKVRAVILTGGGSAFCSGLCLDEMHQIIQEDDNLERWHQDTSTLAELLQLMLHFPKPIIAAVNGPAIGFGAGLVLASDLAIAGPEATLGFPEPKRGIISGLCAPLLFFRVGGRHAARLLLTGETISAQRAAEIGAYDEIVPAKNLWAYGAELTKQIAQSAPQAIQQTKRHLNDTVGEQLEMLISLGAAASATSRTTEAAKEGLQAYIEKREPEWP
ncbi:enoyl-CoA hydratase/isomerase family protein [Bremerella cremea]|uniref:enoyl-CoA hydratase/isomerase family protein n=1 Tax=Bremerella cremea TaxID=1031537 RepID=UPI0031E69AE8